MVVLVVAVPVAAGDGAIANTSMGRRLSGFDIPHSPNSNFPNWVIMTPFPHQQNSTLYSFGRWLGAINGIRFSKYSPDWSSSFTSAQSWMQLFHIAWPLEHVTFPRIRGIELLAWNLASSVLRLFLRYWICSWRAFGTGRYSHSRYWAVSFALPQHFFVWLDGPLAMMPWWHRS